MPTSGRTPLAAPGRGGGAGAGGTGQGKRGKNRDRSRGQDRDLLDDGQDWLDDEGTAPTVLD